LFAKHDSAAEACLCRAKKTSQDSSVCSESAHAVVDLAGLIIHAATSDTSILLLTGEHAKRLFILFLDTLFRHLTIHDVFTLDAGLARHIITTCTTLLRDSSPRVRYLMGYFSYRLLRTLFSTSLAINWAFLFTMNGIKQRWIWIELQYALHIFAGAAFPFTFFIVIRVLKTRF
jgi:hypothetical protein